MLAILLLTLFARTQIVSHSGISAVKAADSAGKRVAAPALASRSPRLSPEITDQTSRDSAVINAQKNPWERLPR
ncbi:hypothetical protein [Dyadobacter psychrotolerans]|uniref:Uncharacterized protein n=1 Tax=Dyadobacter psychrotolerans TaxID=2541721 RepID=A0A4R5DJ53_9BACT|nr:hypothetical protein [Dyadobacter psychrotolerans]TDE10825.1 hypothetical protein E0F88_27515 [Dyadobacter psychrotolerans]